MKFEVYCDESSQEAFVNPNEHKYVGIGGIWLPSDQRENMKNSLKKIKAKYAIHGEFKWNKVSPAFIDFYMDIIEYFFEVDYIRFRVIIIEAVRVKDVNFNNYDKELSFYKFYYQLLHHWLFDFNKYNVFLDLKTNQEKGRLFELRQILDDSNLTSEIIQVQGLPSEQSLGIQLADLLTGLSTAKFNNKTTSPTKLKLIKLIETKLEKEIKSTSKWEEKFNVFQINLEGGW